ncbi:acyltransferase family protein [Kineococcus sp. SYSU DK005]|uniref:acyltransferase family protein n=1 Tax=Kineococcus sp. SYSU DK005 TaxID=3383126 RepID=UPI003D7D7928
MAVVEDGQRPGSVGAAGPSGRGAFRPDVEGLRAVALGMVLLFQAAAPVFVAGNIGVDVFFVISGFLITGLLVREAERTGGVSLRDFYARRARRILPSAAAVLLLTLLGVAVLLPERLAAVARDAVAAGLQVANWWLLSFDVHSLHPEVAHSPLKHYWTLAVEEQFYLLWPLLVLLVARRAGRTGRTGRHALRPGGPARLRRDLALALAVLSALSLAASAVLTPQASLFGYLSTVTRAWQFGVGGLLALAAPLIAARCADGRGAALLRLAGWAGALVLAVSAVFATRLPYPGWIALVPTLATAAVIASGTTGVLRGSVGQLLSLPLVRAAGRLSYVWYLWHVPAVVFAAEVLGTTHWAAMLAAELAAVVPALLTARLVEGPLRFSPLVAASARRGLVLGAATTGVTLTAGLALAAVA